MAPFSENEYWTEIGYLFKILSEGNHPFRIDNVERNNNKKIIEYFIKFFWKYISIKQSTCELQGIQLMRFH